MVARSIAGFKGWLQRETTPGTAITAAMIKPDALKFRPGWDAAAQTYRGGSGKAVTDYDVDLLNSPISVEGIGCFRAIGLALASVMARPTTTVPAGGTLSKQHVFEINPDAEDTKATYTGIFGDATQSLQTTYAVFMSFSVAVARGNLTFATKMMGREATTGATIPSSGVVAMPQQIIPVKKFNVYLDDTWAALGTTKALAAYEAGVDIGDKFDPDAPIDSSLTGFQSLLEKEEQDQTASFRLGFDAVAIARFTNWKTGSRVFMRLECIHPTAIEGTIYPTLLLDASLQVTKPGEIGKAPNSSAVTLPFDAIVSKDPTSSKLIRATLINDVASY